MDITRAEVNSLILPGYVTTIEYLKPDNTAKIIGFGEGGSVEGEATHALCCQGGLDIVEATLFGVAETNLHNYLTGNTRLTIRTTKTPPTPEQAKRATDFWFKRVNDPYDLGMIVGSIPILFAKHVLGFFSKDLGDLAIRKMPNLLASSNLSTCAELCARGLYEYDASVFPEIPLFNINPEILRTDESLNTVAILDGAVLVD